MSWGSGAGLLEEILDLVEHHIPKKKRKETVQKMMWLFEDLDADFGYEPESPTLKELYKERYDE